MTSARPLQCFQPMHEASENLATTPLGRAAVQCFRPSHDALESLPRMPLSGAGDLRKPSEAEDLAGVNAWTGEFRL